LPSHTHAGDLFGPNWLLVYEGAAQGWLNSAVSVFQSDRYFKQLLQNGVKFFDSTRVPAPVFTFKGESGNPAVTANSVFDSDRDVYEYFEFSESDEDYLGRRLRKEEDEDEANVIGDAMSLLNDRGDADDDLPW